MAWTEITTKDIAIQGEDFKYNCMASGTIKKGQALVNITDGDTSDIYVISSSLATSTKFVGVAVTDAVKGEPVAVYGQGAICWGRGDSALTYGDYLIADDDGVDVDDSDYQGFAHSLQEIGLIIDNTPPNELYSLMSEVNPDASEATDRIIRYLQKSEIGLLQMLMKLFTPNRNGFQLKRLSKLTPQDIDYKEIWFSAPSILIKADRV